jgi:chromosome partitioning protein
MDLVLIDTMPRVEKPCVEAAKVAQLGVIPCGPSPVDMEAIGATISIIRREKIPGCIVLNQGRPGSPINEKAAKVLAQYGLPVCPVHIMRRAALADAFIDGRAVVELEPQSKGAEEVAKSWKWITRRLKD